MSRKKRTKALPSEGTTEGVAEEVARFYEGIFTEQEWREIKRQLASPQASLEMEVALLRVMIRRAIERMGEEDPLKALAAIRLGVDAIGRALRNQRVLSGEAADSLAEAFAVALREIGEEMGLDGG
nr:hypothetical protein [Chloroflexota bacterium]